MSSASSTFASGGNPTAAQVNGWAQGTLGYAQVVANQTGITTETDLTSLTATVTLVAGRRIRISAQAGIQSSVTGDTIILRIKEGATVLQQAVGSVQPVNSEVTFSPSVVLTPTVGSHTYKLSLLRLAGTGTLTMVGASNDVPFILVEDIGAV
jgi:hypothetical protein